MNCLDKTGLERLWSKIIGKIPTDNNELTNGAGYITGITSSDVTTALGYTPYNSTNPNGYQTSSQVDTKIANAITTALNTSV